MTVMTKNSIYTKCTSFYNSMCSKFGPCSMTHGESSIIDNYQRMKSLAVSLGDVDHPVQDLQLVLNLLCSLNAHYSNNTVNDIANTKGGFPSFSTSWPKTQS